MKIREDPNYLTYLWELESGCIELIIGTPESNFPTWITAEVDQELTPELAREVGNVLLQWADTGKLDERK